MKLSVLLLFGAGLFSVAFGKPAGIILGYQDGLGQYSFGYSAPYQARSEVRSVDGVTRGSYSYVDGAGLVQSTDYTADGEHGFRVAATNLPQAPVPVQDTPEVAAARAAHLLAVEQAAGRNIEDNQQAAADDQSDGVSVVAESSADAKSFKDEVPSVEAAAEPGAKESPVEEKAESVAEAKSVAADEGVEKKDESQNHQDVEQQQKGRAIGGEQHVAPVIASGAATLPVPLIPVNFDVPSVSVYSVRPAGAKAEQGSLPQATPAQGLITPAGTKLKSLPGGQVIAVAPRVALPSESQASESSAQGAAASSVETSRDFPHYERARAVFAPVVPSINVIPYGYDPTVASFLRYAPFPYIAYNVL
ncbi:uncharacterized protein LOC110117249 isoform X2 [Athalia rosae]|uniref:uncharacterized protein LOC110117249 isoform X2 n=1 Tax=Athalia rosae TaxID=37344 RepID=UPI0020339777|nr:uncharacterized protein LOC110117249 isoform X2 [Athalia rosae]